MNEIVGIGALNHFEQELALQHASPAAVLDTWLTLQTCFSHPSLVILLSNTPTHPSKTRTANSWETTSYVNRNPPGTIKLSRLTNQHQYVSLDFAAVHFASLSKYIFAGTKPFCWAKPACFDFSSSNFNLQRHWKQSCGVTLSELVLKWCMSFACGLLQKRHAKSKEFATSTHEFGDFDNLVASMVLIEGWTNPSISMYILTLVPSLLLVLRHTVLFC